MTLNLTYPPQPGVWAMRAQDCLDQLSTMTTPDEVIAAYGSIRAVVGETLGFPATGGCGTKAVIRATGKLFGHRLSPSLATEALTWAASVTGAMDPASITTFLERAGDVDCTFRPRQLTDRDLLLGHLARCTTEKVRLTTLVGLWEESHRQSRSEYGNDWRAMRSDEWYFDRASLHEGESDWLERDSRFCFPGLCRSLGRVAPEEWLFRTAHGVPILGGAQEAYEWRLAVLHRWDVRLPGTAPTPSQVAALAEPAQQLALYHDFDVEQRRSLLASTQFFELCDAIVAAGVAEFPKLAFDNPGCPEGLVDLVAHPSDRATLELALAAGWPHYELARVRRLLSDLDDATHIELLECLGARYLRAIRVCGLNSAEALICGRLSGLDLSERRVAQAVLGVEGQWRHWREIENLADILLGHPQAGLLGWLVDSVARYRGMARRLVAQGCAKVAEHAIWSLGPEDLCKGDAPSALRAGDYLVAQCPGIPAIQRPTRRLKSEWKERLQRRHGFDPFNAVPSQSTPGDDFTYSDEIRSLCGTYRQAPGWEVSLPANEHELEANAAQMGNCTGGYAPRIRNGSTFIVFVCDPAGERFNVEVLRRRGRFKIGQINGRHNSGARPTWITDAFRARINTTSTRPQVGYREPAPLTRRPTDRRDRRRTRTSPIR